MGSPWKPALSQARLATGSMVIHKMLASGASMSPSQRMVTKGKASMPAAGCVCQARCIEGQGCHKCFWPGLLSTSHIRGQGAAHLDFKPRGTVVGLGGEVGRGRQQVGRKRRAALPVNTTRH